MLTSTLMMLALTGHPPSSLPKPEEITLEGTVREVSGGPGGKARALLTLEDDTYYVLYGRLPADQKELLRLSGTRIRISGVTADPRLPRGRHVYVDAYEIIAVGKGSVPELGHIAQLKMGGKTKLIFVTEDGTAALLPDGWMSKMKRHIGAKVWMIGKRAKGKIKPSRFSILRTASSRDSQENP